MSKQNQLKQWVRKESELQQQRTKGISNEKEQDANNRRYKGIMRGLAGRFLAV